MRPYPFHARVRQLEAGALRPLLTALHSELLTFAASTDREHFHEPLDQVLEPFSDAQHEVFCTAMAAGHQPRGQLPRLDVGDVAALVEAFRHYNHHTEEQQI